jgi:hypothetical protein
VKLRLTKRDAIDFIDCWRRTAEQSSFVQSYNLYREALVFSFDGEMKPFLNYTRGYHHPRSKRPYFTLLPHLMNEIEKIMRPYRGWGGRVFIDNVQAYYVDESNTKHHLCDLSWPKDVDVVNELKNCRPRCKAAMTLRIRTPDKRQYRKEE